MNDNEDMLTIEVLGPLTVRRDGKPLTIRAGMISNLLALFALHPGQRVPRADVVDLLWDGSPPATYVNLIHVYVSRLRAQLCDGSGDATQIIAPDNGGGYLLDLDPSAVDLVRFERLCIEAEGLETAGDTDTALGRYGAALDYWKSPILAGSAPKFQQHPVVVAAQQRRLGATVAYARLAGALGRQAAAIGMLHRVAPEAPMHEGLHAQLMLALAGGGDRAGALAVYHEIRRRLADELGVDPGAALQAAYLHVLRNDEPEPVPTGQWSTSAEPAAALTTEESMPEPAAALTTEESMPEPRGASGDPGEPRAPATAAAGRSPRASRGYRVAVTAAAVAAATAAIVMIVMAAVRGNGSPATSVPSSPAAAGRFTAAVHWHWAYDTGLGSTATGDQWASARFSGLTDTESCAGFRLRVVSTPVGDDQGVLLAVCHTHWEIEARGSDGSKVDAQLPTAGQMQVSISATGAIALWVNGTVVGTQQLTASPYPGRQIYPAMYQGNTHVVMTDFQSNATRSSAAPTPD
jgi:DNA-binding SARP family transcriptional activator